MPSQTLNSMQKLVFKGKEYKIIDRGNGEFIVPFYDIPLILYTKGVLENNPGILIEKENNQYKVYRGGLRLEAALKLIATEYI